HVARVVEEIAGGKIGAIERWRDRGRRREVVVGKAKSAADGVGVRNLVVDAHVELIRGIRLNRIRQIVVAYTGYIHGSGDVRSGEQIHQSFSDRVKAVRRYLIVREGEPCGITGGVDGEIGRASCRERGWRAGGGG